MTDLVPAEVIERRVGARRHHTLHLGRAVSAEQKVYILHSVECRESSPDLRTCKFSLALDRGIDLSRWVEDTPVVLVMERGRLLGNNTYQEPR